MNKLFIAFYTLIICSLYAVTVNASEDVVLVIEEARVNIAQAGEPSQAYMHIINYSEKKNIQLVEVSSQISKSTKLNQSPNLLIPAGKSVELTADGIYIDLQQVTSPIKPGNIILLTLTFAHGDSYKIEAIAVRPGEHVHEDESGHKVVHSQHN